MRKMIRWVLLAVSLLASPARAEGFATAQAVAGHALFAASELSLLVDMVQTIQGQKLYYDEQGWAKYIIGKRPSTPAIVTYFGVGMLAQAALHIWGPPWLSNCWSAATLMVEIPTISGNWQVGLRFGF